MNDAFRAWAIDTCSEEGHGFIGRYWWFKGRLPEVPEHLEGCRLALFETRAIARRNLPAVKGAFPKAKVKRVRVLVDEI